MKYFSTGALAALFAVSMATAQVSEVKTVYVLPMTGGLDQYLALMLTAKGVLQVVTDPQKADAILTDGIGARFEESVSQLFGAPAEKEKSDKAGNAEFTHPAMRPLSGSRGVIFLVNRTTRDVVWSTFERPRSSQPAELNHVAGKIVNRLAKDRKSK